MTPTPEHKKLAREHAPGLYCVEGPISQNVGGSYTFAHLGCTCGWNADGKAGEWSDHLAALLAEREHVGLDGLRELVLEHRYIRDGGYSGCRCTKMQFSGQSWDEDFSAWWEHILAVRAALAQKQSET